jgi:hypothetical protein
LGNSREGILNGFDLKLIAAALMVLDHVLEYFPSAPIWFGYLGRIVAPIFFYLTVEGFFHTRSRVNYMARLFLGAAVMYVGSRILTHFMPTPVGIPNNIFVSLGLGVALMSAFEWTRETGKYWTGIPMIIAIAAVSLSTEASLYGVAMISVFYFCRNNTKMMAIMYIATSLMISWPSPALNKTHILLYDYQWMMVFATPFFFLYNGKRGPGGEAAKWFFYIFYPAHLWIIYVIQYFTFWV